MAWDAHPGRTQPWYDREVLGAVEPRKARREYAATPEDAFAAPEGVFFERLSDRNIADVEILPYGPTYRCVDHGYHSPACAWVQVSTQGQPFVVGEYVPHDVTTEEFAAGIIATESAWNLVTPPADTFADPAGRAVNVATAKSEAETFYGMGLGHTSRQSSIRDGCVRIMSALADPIMPLVISRRCPWTIEALSAVRPDKHRPDVYDETSEYTHILDALRYYFVNNPRGVADYRLPPSDKPITSALLGKIW
jgi:hypothetical protein